MSELQKEKSQGIQTAPLGLSAFSFHSQAVADSSSKCDERHPLCRNCAKYYPNILKCFEDFPTVAVTASESRDPGSANGSSANSIAHMLPPPPRLSDVVGGGRLDPFETYPATRVPNVDVLLVHCK